jgi:acyl-CoA reductase-like NAD-dependent aldehyde dehydrogenase
VRAQIADALSRGARLLTDRDGEEAVLPAVLMDVPQDAALMREETFGPVAAVAPFTDEEEAVRLANDCDFGLNASVWTTDRKRITRIAARLQSGCVCVNNVLVNAGHPALPFGGVKASGFGRYHGPEGLLAFTRAKAMVDQQKSGGSELHWFPYDRELEGITGELIRLRYGPESGLLGKGLRWLRLAGRRSARLRRLGEEEDPGE